MSADFVAHMEDVLDLYAEPYDPQRPLVCFGETSTQLLADTRPPLRAGDGGGRASGALYKSKKSRRHREFDRTPGLCRGARNEGS